MWQSLEILNYFNTLTLMQVFENLLKKKWSTVFWLEVNALLKGGQNGPIINNEFLLPTTLLF